MSIEFTVEIVAYDMMKLKQIREKFKFSVFMSDVNALMAQHAELRSTDSCSRVILQKLPVLHLVKKLPAVYVTRRFISLLTTARHLFLS